MAVTLLIGSNIIKRNISPQDKLVEGMHARFALSQRVPDASPQEIDRWLLENWPLKQNSEEEYEVNSESDIGYCDRLFHYQEIIDFQPSPEQRLVSFLELLEREAWKGMGIKDIIHRLILANRKQELQVIDPENWYPGECYQGIWYKKLEPVRAYFRDPLLHYGPYSEKLIRDRKAVFIESEIIDLEKLDAPIKKEIKNDVIVTQIIAQTQSASKKSLKDFVKRKHSELRNDKKNNQLPKTKVAKVIFALAQNEGIISLDLSDDDKKRITKNINRYLYSDKAY